MTLFNRNNQEVIDSALQMSKVEFIKMFKGVTTDSVLEKAYFEIRKKNLNTKNNNSGEKKVIDGRPDFIKSIESGVDSQNAKSIVPNTSFDISSSTVPNAEKNTSESDDNKMSKQEKYDFILNLIKQGKTTKEIYNLLPFKGMGYTTIDKLREDGK